MPVHKPQPKSLETSLSATSLGKDDSFNMRSTTGSLPNIPSVALYAAPSYSSLYSDPEDLEPGPGTYDIGQSFGRQQLSQNFSEPSAPLIAKHGKAWSKTMITKDHLMAMMARDSPAPGTYIPRLVKSEARVRFGTSKRPDLCDTHFRAPGPVYEVRGSPDNPPAHIRFSKANRFALDDRSLAESLGSTGPGQYEVKGSVDGSGKHGRSFGASHRAYDRVRFPGSEKEGQGRSSPGPGPPLPYQLAGRSISFCRAERLPGDRNERAPGPGAYEVHEKPNPDMKTQSVYSFGRPSARSRMDFKTMKMLQASSLWGIN